MKEPKSEQLINNGRIEGTTFDNPLDFKEDSWGKYDNKEDRWSTYVATFGQVRKWIQTQFYNISDRLQEITNNINNQQSELSPRLDTIEGNINTLEQNVTNINNKVTNYTVTVGGKEYTQTHNVFRITRPKNTTSWGILNNPQQNMELRLGPFDELIKIGEDNITEDNNHYIELKDVVDTEEEIIIKILEEV